MLSLGFLFSLDRPSTARTPHQPPHHPPVPPQRPGPAPGPASFGGRSATVCSFLNISPISYPGTFLGVQEQGHFYSPGVCRGSHQNRFELCYKMAIVQGTIKFHERNIFNYFISLHWFLHWKYTPTCECLSHINYVFVRDASALKKGYVFPSYTSRSCPIELWPWKHWWPRFDSPLFPAVNTLKLKALVLLAAGTIGSVFGRTDVH